jgi:hypothetical protein
VVVLPGQTCREPLESTLPTPPSIETLLAFDVDQVRVEHPPASTELGEADKEAVGDGADGGGGGAGGATAAFAGHSPWIFAMASAANALASLV